MAVQVSGNNDVLRRPSLRVLASSIQAGGPELETLDPVGQSLDQLKGLLSETETAGPASSLWGQLHDLLARFPVATPKPSPGPLPKPSSPPSRPRPSGPSATSTYTVQPGDSLSAIAQRVLGNGDRWRQIYDLNRSVIGSNPDRIRPGQVLRLPGSGGSPAPIQTPNPTPHRTPTPSPSPSGPPVGGTAGQWIAQAMAILEAHGTPAHKMNAQDIAVIIQHESSGNPRAINNWDSNARAGHPSEGIMQTIGPTFNAWAIPGHTDIWNPVDNIIAGVRYAVNRYGSIQNVPGIVNMAQGGSYVGY